MSNSAGIESTPERTPVGDEAVLPPNTPLGATEKKKGFIRTAQEPVPEAKPDHVVVFVHGMGEALKGGTLLEWSEPLIESLREVAMDNIDLALKGKTPSSTEPSPPPLTIEAAHTTKDVPEIYVSVYKPEANSPSTQGPSFTTKDNDPKRLTVLLTEAHWAQDFTPSKTVTTWLWGLKVSVRVWWRSLTLVRWNLYILRSSRDTRLMKTLNGMLFLLSMVLIGLVGLVTLPVLALLLLFLGVLIGLAKVPGIKPWAGKIVVLFGNFLGDPATWNKRPTQAAAMRQKVIDIVGGFPNTNVTVVAHSQGAAVAGQVILSGRILPTNFVTVGSGLPLLGYAKYGANYSDDPVKEWDEHASRLRWINLWGKFDFVPAGPMSVRFHKGCNALNVDQDSSDGNGESELSAKPKSDRRKLFKLIYSPKRGSRQLSGPEEHPIFNRSAMIRDHIVYSKNRIEVIDPLARLIYKNEDAPTEDPDRAEALPLWFEEPGLTPKKKKNEHIRLKRHRHMVIYLGISRFLVIWAGVFLALPVTLLVQRLLSSRDGTLCGPEVSPWPCVQSDFLWFSFDIRTDWALLLSVGILIFLFLWFLNGVVWNSLHRKIECRRDEQGKSFYGGKWSLGLYLGTVGLLTIVFPAAVLLPWQINAGSISGIPNFVYFIYAAVLIFLVIASLFAGKDIKPLPAKLKSPEQPQKS